MVGRSTRKYGCIRSHHSLHLNSDFYQQSSDGGMWCDRQGEKIPSCLWRAFIDHTSHIVGGIKVRLPGLGSLCRSFSRGVHLLVCTYDTLAPTHWYQGYVIYQKYLDSNNSCCWFIANHPCYCLS